MVEQRMYHQSFAALYPFAKQVCFESGSDSGKADIHRIVLESTNSSQHPYRPLQKAQLPIPSDTTPHQRWKTLTPATGIDNR